MWKINMSSMFDKEVNRRGTGSMKWNVGEYELPMWVADMDFETAPAVTKAIMDRAVQGIYGYTEVSEEWYLACRRELLKEGLERLKRSIHSYRKGISNGII